MARKKRYQWDVEADENGAEAPSRSQKKRDSTALQAMGEELAKLPVTKLSKLPLTPDLDEGLRLLARLTDREGRRRQMQYIGRLMRECEPEPIRVALEKLHQGHTEDTAAFHHAEKVRDALLSLDVSDKADKAEEERLLAPWPDAADELRSLAMQARAEKSPHAKRALFRKLRDLVQ